MSKKNHIIPISSCRDCLRLGIYYDLEGEGWKWWKLPVFETEKNQKELIDEPTYEEAVTKNEDIIYIPAPTYRQLRRYLERVYGIDITIEPTSESQTYEVQIKWSVNKTFHSITLSRILGGKDKALEKALLWIIEHWKEKILQENQEKEEDTEGKDINKIKEITIPDNYAIDWDKSTDRKIILIPKLTIEDIYDEISKYPKVENKLNIHLNAYKKLYSFAVWISTTMVRNNPLKDYPETYTIKIDRNNSECDLKIQKVNDSYEGIIFFSEETAKYAITILGKETIINALSPF